MKVMKIYTQIETPTNYENQNSGMYQNLEWYCNFSILQAFAELLHKKVRKTVWGYTATEALSAAELHKIKYEVSYTSLWGFCRLCKYKTIKMKGSGAKST